MSDVRILIVGWGRSGKDEAAQFMHSHLGFSYGGSTSWAAKELVAEHLGIHPMQAWETRHDNRKLWKDYCDAIRRDNPCRLMELALASVDGPIKVITGVRGLPEIDAAIDQNLFDHIVWITRPGIERDFTVDFGADKATSVLFNDGSLRDFHRQIVDWAWEKKIPRSLSEYALRLDEELINQ